MSTKTFRAGIDAGGTTFKCGIMDDEGNIVQKFRVKVSTPDETISNCISFFRPVFETGRLSSFGIASFGPIDIDPQSSTYGTILQTPKPGWSLTNLKTAFGSAMGVPVRLDTDVNGALRAEIAYGAAKHVNSAAYVTIGTGIGAGVFAHNQLLAHPHHPEFGHIAVNRHPLDSSFKSVCQYHDDCLEGLASATAVHARAGDPAALAEDHPAWDIIADYLAQGCRSLFLTLRLERIILGGGLMLAPHLLNKVQVAFIRQMRGYLGVDCDIAKELVHTPALGDDAGLIGAILLGSDIDRLSSGQKLIAASAP
jgi:fructokinase